MRVDPDAERHLGPAGYGVPYPIAPKGCPRSPIHIAVWSFPVPSNAGRCTAQYLAIQGVNQFGSGKISARPALVSLAGNKSVGFRNSHVYRPQFPGHRIGA
jgi:hypothetical protein